MAENELIKIKALVSELQDLLKQQAKAWGDIATAVQKVNKEVPSNYVKMQNQMHKELMQVEALEQKRLQTLAKKEALELKVINTMAKEEDLRRKEIITLQAKETLTQKEINTLNKLEQQQNKVNKAREKEGLTVQKILNTSSSLAKQQEKELQALQKTENIYNKVQAKVNQMTAIYNNLATKKELGLKLNDRELAQLNSLEGRLNNYQNVLRKVDAQIGNNRRNVGNYASGWDGLGNSINQITREMPAFAVSASTGFLALSNNIPMLADEIKRVSDNVAEMRAQGKQVPGVMSQILSSFLSWQTLLSVGVTLLTLYGKELVEFTVSMFGSAKAVDSAKIALESYKEALQSSDFKNAYESVAKVKTAFDLAKEGVISKEKALKTYNTELGDVMGKTNDINKAESVFNAQARNFVEATTAKMQANILFAKSSQLVAEVLELETRKSVGWVEDLKAYVQTGAVFGKMWRALNNDGLGEVGVYNKVMENRSNEAKAKRDEITANLTEAEKLMKTFSEKSTNLNFDTNKGNDKKSVDYTKDRLQAEYELAKAILERSQLESKVQGDLNKYNEQALELLTLEFDYQTKLADLEVKDLETKNKTKLKLVEEYGKNVLDLLNTQNEESKKKFEEDYKNWSDEQKKKADDYKTAEDERIRKLRTAYELEFMEYEEMLVNEQNGSKASFIIKQNQLDSWIKLQRETYKEGSDELLLAEKEYQLRSLELEAQRVAQITSMRERLANIGKDNASFEQFGFGSLDMFSEFTEDGKNVWLEAIKQMETWEEKASAIASSVKGVLLDVFAQISEANAKYYEQQFANLEKEKEVSLRFAGENVAGKEAIEQQYAEKKRQLQQKQAQDEKKMAILSAIVNTATAVVSMLAEVPWPANIVMAGLVGVMGAVQIAKISSTPIPQFYTGTDNAPEGWALTQERGAETILDNNGNIKSLGNNKGAQMTYLSKGDQVLNAQDTIAFHRDLNNMLVGSGISPIVSVNNGITEEQLERVMRKTLGSQAKNHINIDSSGFNMYQEKQNSRKTLKNKNARF